ncbi:uncharacterized protein LOC133484367 isoform X2 [Phyllopteryx taeniolatus]|uniref:uncharacterized protein LOC133484367 isoform X2 n=1 Tax=Phyllopteryx taeniolatus TaxID=161469 RepID=UPI002AD534E6|nr:uncharacterized protein LOC133484367 isoform X2 [Phyllopteryx taeniolatus]
MDSLHDSAGDSKSSVCQCAPKPTVHRWSPGLAVAVCVLMSLSSISVCLLMSFKTLQLEQRLKMELDRATQFNPAHGSFFDEDGSLVPELSTSVGKLVEEKVMVLMPKSRTTRDVGQECACPPAAVKNQVQQINSELAIIPGSLTKELQPLDISVNRAFKVKLEAA